jgi:dTDP-4-dehydrorhamnose reductase
MRLLITGAAGMLGQDVQVVSIAAGHQVVALGRPQLDITDPDAVSAAVGDARPDAVINCAAYTKVDDAEGDAEGAAAINSDAAGVLAAAAAAAGAWLVHVSTDYVFDGAKTTGPYVESDLPDPRSVYGATKLAGERQIAERAPDGHTIVRTAWLFGVGGPCFPATILRLAADRDQLSVVDDQRGTPTYTGHLAGALVRLAEERSLIGVVHVAAAGECSWFEFAREVVAAGGGRAQVNPCTTDEFPRPAPRPAYSVLRSERSGVPVLADWHEGLSEYLRSRDRAEAAAR